jgi:2-polyprenyl-3-methyl-5-hydroxy-6-metoxy-1,4-benzoquinol methylase
MPNPTCRLLRALGPVSGKYICEVGCGGGGLTYELAAGGARVSASDISSEAVALARSTNARFIPGQVDVEQMDVCSLKYGDQSFDLVVGMAILHHVDINRAAKEISRVLKPGGKGVFVEPLGHNPAANLWRRLTPSIRTSDEKPLSYLEISEMGKHFASVDCQEYALLTLLSSPVYLVTHSLQAKKRSAELLARLEPPVLRVCGFLRKYSGAVLVEFTK